MKRMQRKVEQLRISLAKAAVDKANALQDPMEPFSVFRSYNKEGLDCNLFVKKVTDLDEEVKSWIFKLTKKNMQVKYEQSSWGWNDEKKMEELMDDSAWYLIAQLKTGAYMGFSHFRFDLDEGLEVLYCYELQLESSIHRRGLGKFMMQVLELIAFSNNMKKVVLTVLKNNPASNFFKSVNYKLDETSPEDDDEEEFCYEILSKPNKRLISQPVYQSPLLNNHSHSHSHCCSHAH